MSLFRKSTSVVLAACMTVSAATVGTAVVSTTVSAEENTNSYGLMDTCQEGTILHCFDWKYNDIRAELQNIAEAGFTSVQTSPAQPGCGIDSAIWYWLYQPLDFRVGANDLGTKEELRQLCAEAETYGIKVIVDVVSNHLAGDHTYITNDFKDSKYWRVPSSYSGRLGDVYNDIGMPDIKSEKKDVYTAVKNYVQELKDIGVDGIRWDTAKHIQLPSDDSCEFWKAVTSVEGMYHYGEILGISDDSNNAKMKEYTNYMSVTDSGYSTHLRNFLNKGDYPTSSGNLTSSISADKLVYWAESHDTWANNKSGGYSNETPLNVIDKAYAIAASRAGATALYFSRPDYRFKENIKAGVKGSTHFTSAEVAAVNHFHNAMYGQADYYQKNGDDKVVAVCREKGAVVVKAEGGNAEVYVKNGGDTTAAGTYIDEITGNTWTVTKSNGSAIGTISGTIGETGIAVLYKADEYTVTPLSTASAATTTGTLYFDNSQYNWGSVYAYVYDGMGTAQNAAKPGVQMTLVSGSSTLYKLENVDTYNGNARVIFFNANQSKRYPASSTNAANQSIDVGMDFPKDAGAMILKKVYCNDINQDMAWKDIWDKYTPETASASGSVSMTASASSFTDTLSVTLYASGVTNPIYMTSDGQYGSFTDGQTITIGANASKGTIKVAVKGLKSDGTTMASQEKTFTKTGGTETSKVIYLVPNSDWKADNARFALYTFGSDGDKWTSMTKVNDDLYSVTIPDGNWTNVIFCRMNGSNSTNAWGSSYVLDQTVDIPVPTGSNRFYITEKQGGDGKKWIGNWNHYPCTHSYYDEPVWTWNDDYTSATATFTCEDCSETTSVTATGGSITSTAEGSRTVYTATVTFNDETYTDQKKTGDTVLYFDFSNKTGWENDNARFAAYVFNSAVENAWFDMTKVEDVSYMYSVEIPSGWNNIIFCRMNGSTTENNWDNKWGQTADLTIPTDGKNRFVMAENKTGGTYSGTWDTYVLPHTHEYTPIWNWADDNQSATLTLTCSCGDSSTHISNTVSSTTVTPPTCTTEGTIVYTVSVTVDGTPYSTSKTVAVPATGEHSYGTPEWSWSDDYSTATATFTCTECGSGEQTVNAAITSNTTATQTVYTATVTFNEQPYTDTKTVALPDEPEETDSTVLYLKPSSYWKAYDADFALYTFNASTNLWTDMTKINDDLYSVQVPQGDWDGIIFVRLNPNRTETRWNQSGESGKTKPVWSQTYNLTVPENGNNIYKIAEEDSTKVNGTWGFYSELQTPMGFIEKEEQTGDVEYQQNNAEMLYEIFEGILSHETAIDVSEYSLICGGDYDNWEPLSDALNYTYPELFFLDRTNPMSCNLISEDNGKTWIISSIVPDYTMNLEETNAKLNAFYEKAAWYLSHIDDSMDDFTKALVLHDLLVLNNYYPLTQEEMNAANNYDFMVNGWGVCQNYTEIYAYLLAHAGIKSEIINSDSMNHAWLKVCLDGSYYNVDVTWDDPSKINGVQRFDKVYHTYFLLSDTLIQNYGDNRPHYGYNTYYNEFDTTYDGYSTLHDMENPIFRINGELYTIYNSQIGTYTNNTFTGKYTITDNWSGWGNYSGIAEYNGELYFNDSNHIYVYDPSANTAVTYMTSSNGTTLYGMYIKDGVIHGLVADTPNDKPTDVELGSTATIVEVKFIDVNNITTTRKLPAEAVQAADVAVPNAPYLDGYNFDGWTINGTPYGNDVSAVQTAVANLVATNPEQPVTVKEVYSKNPDTYSVTVTGGTLADGTISCEYQAADQVTVTADTASDGYKFSHWLRDGTIIVSSNEKYTFFMPSSAVTLKAEYVADSTTVEPQGTAFIESVKQTAANKLAFVAVCNVPQNGKMVKGGLVATKDSSIGANVTAENAQFVKISSKTTANTKNLKYTWTKSNVSADDMWYVRAYLVYTDSEGNEHTIYSDAVTGTIS